jgi:hypothetical protein
MILVEESHVEGQSIFMINIHHTFGDGLVYVAVLNAAASNGFQGMANLQTGKQQTTMQEIVGFKDGIFAFLKMLSRYNPFMNEPEDCNHRYLFSKNLPIGKMKAACKKFKMPL